MKPTGPGLAATAGLLVYAALAATAPAGAADRFGDGDRGAARPPAAAIAPLDEPAGSGIDTRGRSVRRLEAPSGWPFVTDAFRQGFRSARPFERREQLALSLRFGDVSGSFLFAPATPFFGPAVPWSIWSHYGRARPAWLRQPPLILHEWPRPPSIVETPRYRQVPPDVRRRFDATGPHRARPHPPRLRDHGRPPRLARPAFRRWGD